jgi:hypothetical protein
MASQICFDEMIVNLLFFLPNMLSILLETTNAAVTPTQGNATATHQTSVPSWKLGEKVQNCR